MQPQLERRLGLLEPQLERQLVQSQLEPGQARQLGPQLEQRLEQPQLELEQLALG